MKKIIALVVVLSVLFGAMQTDVFAAGNGPEAVYEKGMGCFEEKEYADAFSYFYIAGEARHYAPAENMLGVCYRDGLGTEQDLEEAEKYFRLSADQGYEPAQENLAVLGEVKSANEAEKRETYQNAVNLYFDGKYEEAREVFEALGEYEHSTEFIVMCNKEIQEQGGGKETPVSDPAPNSQSSNDSSSGGMIVPPESQNPDMSAVNLDVVQDSSGKYVLTINGSKLAWGQSIESAAQFCNQNGLEVKHFDNDINKDAFTLDQNIIFGGTIDVSKAFYIRRAANSSKLQQIDLHNESRCDENTAIESGQHVYQTLQYKFGTPDKGVRLYANNEWSDFGANQLSEAVNKLINSEIDYGFVAVNYKNISLYIVRYTDKKGPYYNVQLTLIAS